jgi:hypothetical protein
LEIFNASNRWDKERSLYHSFGEDRSSFGFLTYKEAKERKDVLTRMFSKKAIGDVQGIIVEKVTFFLVFIHSSPFMERYSM